MPTLVGQPKAPTNSAVAAQVLRLGDDPNSSAAQLADVIRTDPALTSRLLETANAARFALREPVATIGRAVSVLGLRRTRMVALGFQVAAHPDELGGCPFDLKTFWRRSLLRACLAQEIAAEVVPTLADEAYVIGLLQDCGIVHLVQSLGASYAALYATANLSPAAFYKRETQRFAHNHVEAIDAMAEQWSLPQVLADPLGRHHCPVTIGPESSELETLSAVSYFVGSLPLGHEEMLALSDPALRDYAAANLALAEPALQDCLGRADHACREMAPSPAEHLPENLDRRDLVEQANCHLSRATSEAARHIEAVEAECDLIRGQQMDLKSALGQYRELAARDPLTHLLNRGALAEAAMACIRKCRDKNTPQCVFFLDIDDFKVINDDFGHHMGDEVLRVLAGVVSDTVVNGGCAGRYGGEEFIVVLPALDEQESRRRAEGLVDRVRRTSFPDLFSNHSVTCSLGAVWGRPKPGMSAQELFTAADELMYQAKLGGKDRCCFRSFESPDAVLVLAPNGRTVQPAASSLDDVPIRSENAHPTPEEFHRLAVELNRSQTQRFADLRKRERHGLLTPCVVNCFIGGSPTLQGSAAYVRNISTGGLGVLAVRPMIRGEPVEVALQQEDEHSNMLYVAGLVAFCRHVEGRIYEVGIQLLAQAKDPIFSRDPSSAAQRFDWVVAALRTAHDQGEPLKEGA
ncbi:MAG: HDOD domain-containing protein [Planctomycetes bacterium]|nr:HDOD domain-containing protein [Planctomycetota bacterium]